MANVRHDSSYQYQQHPLIKGGFGIDGNDPIYQTVVKNLSSADDSDSFANQNDVDEYDDEDVEL